MTTINKEEIQKFSDLAEEWWDVKGKFKPLHMFNPIWIEYIIENIPLNGFQDINRFLQFFDDIDLSSPNGKILFTSDIFNIKTVIDYEGYSAS